MQCKIGINRTTGIQEWKNGEEGRRNEEMWVGCGVSGLAWHQSAGDAVGAVSEQKQNDQVHWKILEKIRRETF